jgi:hypothetical protein
MIDGGETIKINEIFNPTAHPMEETVLFESSAFVRRLNQLSPRCRIICDTLPSDGVEIWFFRWMAGGPDTYASFRFPGEASGFVSDERMGTLLTGGEHGEAPLVWFPREMVVGRRDRCGRVTVVDGGVAESWWEMNDAPTFHLRLSDPEGAAAFWPMVVFTEEAQISGSDIFQLTEIEQQRFLKSDWFDASSPADLWRYFLDGSVYDPRDAGQGRFRCQQCALAWWSYLMALHRETRKPHYRALARAVAWTVCIDLGDDGSWRHGFWREEPEIHARFFWDGVRVLLAEHEANGDYELLTAAKEAARFALDHLSDTLDQNRLWWLHDSLESEDRLGMRPSILGRSVGNSLCLNTHIQAQCVLAQLIRLSPEAEDLVDAYDRGLDALQVVLELGGGGTAFRIADRWLPSLLSWKIPHGFRERVLRFLVFRMFAWALWKIRRGAPRLVFPNGYLDRDLGRTMLADEYHIVNLKELIGFYRVEPRQWIRPVIDQAYTFAASLDFSRALERHPIWVEWSDVVAVWGSRGPVRVDDDVVGRSIRESLGGSSLDAFCYYSGVKPAGTVPGAGSYAP